VFGISRKAGDKIFDHYQECGVQGLATGADVPKAELNSLLKIAIHQFLK
jgi:hypothetical protein